MRLAICCVLTAGSALACLATVASGVEPAAQQTPPAELSLPQAPQVDSLQAYRTRSETECRLTLWLNIGLAWSGDDNPRVHCHVAKAVDDTGADLLREPPARPLYAVSSGFGWGDSPSVFQRGQTPMFDVKLPSRQAQTIQELSGMTEVFYPNRDPDASILVKDFVGQNRLEVTHPLLTAGGAKVTIASDDEFNAVWKKAEHERTLAAKREKANKAHDENNPAQNMLDAVAEGFATAIFAPDDQNSSSFNVAIFRDDPNDRIVDVEFLNGESAPFTAEQGWESGTIDGKSYVRYHFQNRLPTTTTLRIVVATSKNTEQVPFTVKDIQLP
jgi:hypothetical protein